MEQNFIRTQDENTAATLIKLGYQQISNTDKYYTFINDKTLKYDSSIDIRKLKYTNMLYV